MKYDVSELEKSPMDVLTAITEGLTELRAGYEGEAGFKANIVMLLEVEDNYAEIVREAARRQGVSLRRVQVSP